MFFNFFFFSVPDKDTSDGSDNELVLYLIQLYCTSNQEKYVRNLLLSLKNLRMKPEWSNQELRMQKIEDVNAVKLWLNYFSTDIPHIEALILHSLFQAE